MAQVADEILVNIQVNKTQADNAVRQWQSQYQRSMQSVERQTIQTENQIRRSSGDIGGHLRTLAGALAAGASVQGMSRLLDNYTQLQNRLKVAGLEGREFANVQEELFTVANRNGTAINGLGELYARMALSQKDLGASTEQMLAVTSGVSAALRVQGLSAEQAAGPLLQLGQAFGAVVVRAEEFDSLIEGMPSLVQAAAKYIDGAGGSISRLRAIMLEGKVTSQEFFQALLKGLPELEATASKSTLTIGQSMTVLNNELIKYAGQVDANLGVTEKFAAVITLLSANLDKIAPAIAVIAAVLGGRFLAGLIGGAVGAVRMEAAFQRSGGAALVAAAQYDKMTASKARFATASQIAAAQASFAAGQLTRMQIAAKTTGAVVSRAGSAILGAFGGPIGLAVTGVALAIGVLAGEATSAAADIKAMDDAVASADSVIAKFNPVADTAAGATADVGSEALVAVPKIDSFAGAVGRAAQELYNLANAKRAAALAELSTERENVSRTLSRNIDRSPEGVRRRLGETSYSIQDAISPVIDGFVGGLKDIYTGGESTQTLNNTIAEGRAALGRLDVAIANARDNLDQFAKPDPVTRATPTGTGSGGRRGSGRSAAAAAERAENDRKRAEEEALRRTRAFEDDIFRAGDNLLAAMMERNLTAEDRLQLEKDALQRDRDANKRALDRQLADGEITQTQYDLLKELEDGVQNERAANLERQGQQAIREQASQAEQAMLDLQLDLLNIQAGSAKTAAESRRVQLEILRLQQERERQLLEERISSDRSLDGPGLRARLGALQQAQTASVIQSTQDPLEQWFSETLVTAEQVREAYQQVAADGLDSISNGLVDVITGTKTAKEAFADMARSILADIAKIAAKQFVANIFGGGKSGGGGFNIGSIFSSIFGKPGAINNIGSTLGSFKPGAFGPSGMAATGSKGAGAFSAAASMPQPQSTKVIQQFFVDAKGSVLANDLMDGMQQVAAEQAANSGVAAVAFTQQRQQRAGVRNRQRFV